MSYANFSTKVQFSYIFNFYKPEYFLIEKQAKVKTSWIQSRPLSQGLLFFILHTPLDYFIQLRGLNYHLSSHSFKSLSLAQASVPDDKHTSLSVSWAASPGLTTGNILCPKLGSLLPPYKHSPSIFLILDCGTNIFSWEIETLVSTFSLISEIQILLFLLMKYFRMS